MDGCCGANLLMKKVEEDRAAHSPGSAIDDEEARKRAWSISRMSPESMKALHMIQHLLICQDKRMTRLKAVKYFFIWHQKAMVARYKTAYVRTVDPLRAHIRYQERLLQHVEDDIQHELGKRESSFKPVLMSTGLGARNALKVAAVRLRKETEKHIHMRTMKIKKLLSQEQMCAAQVQR